MRFAIVFAWAMQFVVIEWEIYSITKDPLSLGIIGLAEIIPALALALPAGHFVDRWEKRSLLVRCFLGFLVVSTGLFVITIPAVKAQLPEQTVVWVVYALVFAGGLVRAFIGPTIFSLIGMLVPRELYANAATWSSTGWQMGAVLGPAIGGFAITGVGVHNSLLLVALIGAVGLAFLFRVKPRPVTDTGVREPMGRSLREGLAFVWRTKPVLGSMSVDMLAVLFGGALALLPIYAQDILHVGSIGFGMLRASPAVGSIIVMFVLAHFPITRNAGWKLLAAVFAFGLCMIVFGVSTSFWLSFAALFVSGVVDGVSVVVRNTILQLETPTHIRGRVSSVNMMFVGSSNELGAFESGLTAKLMGTVPAVVVGGLLTLVITVACGVAWPELREMEFVTAPKRDAEEAA
jgi:MFS family permease